jgi:hypothetical protein
MVQAKTRVLRWLKRCLLLGPMLLLAGVVTYTAYQRSRIDELLSDPNGLSWTSEGTRLEIQASEEREGVLSKHVIRVLHEDGSVAHESRFEIDWDAGLAGGGFVRAMQADGDPELEVGAWASNTGASHETRRPFFLDHQDGRVSWQPFEASSEEAKRLALRWLQCNVVRGLEITLLIGLSVVYYVFFGLVAGMVALVRRIRRRGVT